MKLRGHVASLAISLAAGILLETVIFPSITPKYQNPEPTPLEVRLELVFNIEVKTME